ncbi:hypothetical protein MBLNU230_g0354t1 [Neophaeotheca triangularis]
MAAISPPITPARILILLGNLFYGVGAFVADWSETHVLNPRWPPHAKFHNGQTMTLGVFLSLTSLYFAFRPAATVQQAKENTFNAALVGSFYCAAGLVAILYPGTDWNDPEFEKPPQDVMFTVVVAMMWSAYLLEHRRLAGLDKKSV